MEYSPLIPSHHRHCVLSLEQDADTMIETLQQVDSPTYVRRLSEFDVSDYMGKFRCAICWEIEPLLFEQPIMNYYRTCGHVCCYECTLRWLFVSGQQLCPICVANEVSSQVRVKLMKVVTPSTLPMHEWKQAEHFSLNDRGLFLHPEGNNNDYIIFTLDKLASPQSTGEYVSTLNAPGGISTVQMMKIGIFKLVRPKEDSVIEDNIRKMMSLYCSECELLLSPRTVVVKSKIDVESIGRHMKSHGSAICELCFKHSITFLVETQVFTPAIEINVHNKQNHLQCTLCGVEPYLYDKDSLVEHCRRQHYSCYVCDSTEVFFLTKEFLYWHIEKEHLDCSPCRNKGQIKSFLTVRELCDHNIVEHAEVYQERQFDDLMQTHKNVYYYTETPFRMKLDQIDGLLRKCYRESKFNYRDQPN